MIIAGGTMFRRQPRTLRQRLALYVVLLVGITCAPLSIIADARRLSVAAAASRQGVV